MLKGRRHNPLAVLCGTLFGCLSACAAQQQGESSTIGDESELPKVGELFRDCPECPDMVIVPPGSFLMGSPDAEEGRRRRYEGPLHRVTFAVPFAVGIYEVTFDEWDACVADGGCLHRPYDGGWGRGRRPVVHVSWQDAHAYVAWLSELTGKDYRLLSESEWEYAARAGTATPFHTGATISTDQANYNGDYVYGNGREGEYRGRTLPVGSFLPNDWGLHDVHGNVWEWVEDDWSVVYDDDSLGAYQGAPVDGSVREFHGECCVVRGGSWLDLPWFLRSAARIRISYGSRYNYVGFRVALALTQ